MKNDIKNDIVEGDYLEKVVVVGNGFDLSLGLKSSFYDFIKNKILVDYNKYYDDLSDEERNYILGEMYKKNRLFVMTRNRASMNWADFESVFEKQILEINYTLADDDIVSAKEFEIDFLNKNLEHVEKEFHEYMTEQQNNYTRPSNTDTLMLDDGLNSLFNGSYVVNFNYTNTLKNTFKNCYKIWHIHGDLANHNIIIGGGLISTKTISGERNNWIKGSFKNDKTFRMKQNTKLTDDYIKNYKDFVKENKIRELHILGHSVVGSDFEFLYEMMNNSDKIVVYDYNGDSAQKLEYIMQNCTTAEINKIYIVEMPAVFYIKGQSITGCYLDGITGKNFLSTSNYGQNHANLKLINSVVLNFSSMLKFHDKLFHVNYDNVNIPEYDKLKIKNSKDEINELIKIYISKVRMIPNIKHLTIISPELDNVAELSRMEKLRDLTIKDVQTFREEGGIFVDYLEKNKLYKLTLQDCDVYIDKEDERLDQYGKFRNIILSSDLKEINMINFELSFFDNKNSVVESYILDVSNCLDIEKINIKSDTLYIYLDELSTIEHTVVLNLDCMIELGKFRFEQKELNGVKKFTVLYDGHIKDNIQIRYIRDEYVNIDDSDKHLDLEANQDKKQAVDLDHERCVDKQTSKDAIDATKNISVADKDSKVDNMLEKSPRTIDSTHNNNGDYKNISYDLNCIIEYLIDENNKKSAIEHLKMTKYDVRVKNDIITIINEIDISKMDKKQCYYDFKKKLEDFEMQAHEKYIRDNGITNNEKYYEYVELAKTGMLKLSDSSFLKRNLIDKNLEFQERNKKANETLKNILDLTKMYKI